MLKNQGNICSYIVACFNSTFLSISVFEFVKNFTEGSGQNFVDEDFEENSSCKKMKTALVDTTDQEQVMCINFFPVL